MGLVQESRDARFLLGLLVGLLVDGTGGVAPAFGTCFVVWRSTPRALPPVSSGAASVGSRPSTRDANILECGGRRAPPGASDA